jgi:PAS domain S-box-containing protein
MTGDEIYRVIAENASVLIWMSGADKLRTYVNQRWLDFTGRPADSQLGNGWTDGIHPDDRQRILGVYSESFDFRQEFKVEYRLRRHDGQFRWVCDTGVPFVKADGSFGGYLGSCFDITERVLASETLSQANARLIEAQERERTRIARELHDDLGSSLAILGIEILRAGQPVSGSPGQRHPGVQEVYKKLQELASRVSHLSHQLHSPMLEYMGLAKAIEKECREFSEKYRIPVSCSCNELPAMLDPNVAISLLRVVQEALHNVAKHSRADNVTVNVIATSTEIKLLVSDDGVGFDAELSRLAPGIGLISMRERMRLIGGAFEIQAEPGKGAKIKCQAPLVRSETSQNSTS